MHDNELEGRLRDVLRSEGASLPLTISADELERRMALRRRARVSRWAGLAVAGLAVVAVVSLVAASGGWFRSAQVGNEPSASSAPPVQTPGPTADPGQEGLPCTTIEPNESDQPPTIVLGAVPGDSIAYGGALGAYRLGSRQDGEPGNWSAIDATAMWPIPAGPPTGRLQALAGNPDACLTGVTAEAVPFGQPDAPVLPLADIVTDPMRVIEFDQPPAGEWLVRTRITFATQTGVEAWTERFFRVLVHDPSAAATTRPDTIPELATPPGTILVDEGSETAPLIEETGDTADTLAGHVPPRASYRVDVVCLGIGPVSWSIGSEGQLDFLASGQVRCDGTPTSRAVTVGLPNVDLPVVVRSEDRDTAWRIQVSTAVSAPAFLPPSLRMIETGNTGGSAAAAEAFGRCVSTGQATDPCGGDWFVLDGARQIMVPTGSRLTIGLEDGWVIQQARITAAVTDQVRARPFVTEYSVALIDTSGPLATFPVELGRGSWIIRVSLDAGRGEETFGATYDIPLFVGE